MWSIGVVIIYTGSCLETIVTNTTSMKYNQGLTGSNG